MGRCFSTAVLIVSAAFLTGCASYYTRHMSETYKDEKIQKKSFAILPILDIEYNPPSSCFGEGGGSGDKYEQPWLKSVESSLRTRFKDQTFKVYSAEELTELRINQPSLYSAASDEIMTMGVRRVENTPDGPPKLAYETARPAGKVAPYIRPLHDSDKVDYVILLVQPKMTGEIHHHAGTYGAMPGGGMGFSGGGATTTYTSDVQFGIWSAETGELAYSSGAINASSGFCVFVSPQQASIDGTATNISDQLKALIARLLGEEARPLELGRLDPGPR